MAIINIDKIEISRYKRYQISFKGYHETFSAFEVKEIEVQENNQQTSMVWGFSVPFQSGASPKKTVKKKELKEIYVMVEPNTYIMCHIKDFEPNDKILVQMDKISVDTMTKLFSFECVMMEDTFQSLSPKIV